jgi:hypothetical protein
MTGSRRTARFARILGFSEDRLAYEKGEMVDGLYVQDERIKRVDSIAKPTRKISGEGE